MTIKQKIKLIMRKKYDRYLMNLSDEKKLAKQKIWYEKKMGKVLDIENPRTFNEKIQWLKMFDATPIKTQLADKYEVRNWVAEVLGEDYLIPLLGVYNSFDEIDFDELPEQFVMKTNHSSGWNIIVSDKSKFNKAQAKDKFDTWLQTNFAFRMGFEMHYMNIQPKIVIEKYMADLDGDIFDYRFFCFNGDPKYVWVDIGSGTTNHKRNIYDSNWILQDYKVNYPNLDYNVEKPSTFAEMLKCARGLSKDFAFVRVDLFSVKGRVLFGEMTFTPQSGTGRWESEEQNEFYGALIKLPSKKPIPRPKR